MRVITITRWMSWLGIGFLLTLVLTGCGDTETESLSAVSDAGAPATASASGDGCWRSDQAAQTTTSTSEGSTMASKQYDSAPAMAIATDKQYTATLETNKGTIEVELYPNDAPKTVNNFVCLARDGYFDGTPFHRIVQGFVIQGGDPTGTGSGGPGYKFTDEPISREYEKGTLAMANAGPNTNGSQFFIVLDDLQGRLPKNYTIFGKVTSGQEAVDAIAAVPTRQGASGEKSQPTEPVTLDRVTIEES